MQLSGSVPVLFASVWLSACGCASPPSSGIAAAAPDPLANVNTEARSIYRRARDEALARVPVIFVAEGPKLTLLFRGARFEAQTIPDSYHAVKAVDHVALGLHTLLAHSDGRMTGEQRALLGSFRAALLTAEPLTARHDLTAAQKARADVIFQRALGFVDETLEAGGASRDRLIAFDRELLPLLLENSKDAARSQLGAIHAAVMGWRPQIPDADWERARAVVLGPHMARDGQIVVQYFDALFGEAREEGGRVVYAEAVSDERAALDLLATHIVDADVGEGFFGDPFRMHRDLLSTAAAEVVEELFPRR